VFKNLTGLSQQDLLDHLTLAAYLAELAEWDNRAHLERIRRYSYLLADGTDLDRIWADLVSAACMLHDIGKITLPVTILSKTASLEPAEYKIAERHTVEGARILRGSGSPILQMAETIALRHHERWDGGGYPDGLGGDAIPLSARIMALADVYDALATKRPYKPAIAPEAAFDLVKTSSGTLFDPKLVSVFVERYRDFSAVSHGDNTRVRATP
jgi:putative two-component system response regulator